MKKVYYFAALFCIGFAANAQQKNPQDQIDNQNVTRAMNESATGNKFDSYGAKRDAALDRIDRETPTREAPEKPTKEAPERPTREAPERNPGGNK